mmetsp:Transcript_41465/g.115229  ORF Transcript_41465/g.115229 Transcript_41465/m.115229 type:complete len:300 (-) Transcript_41465:195-1094(-)
MDPQAATTVFREGEQGEIVKLLAESPVAVTEDVRHLPSRKAPFRIGWRAVLLLAASAAVLLLLYVGDREQNASTAPKTSDVSALQALDLVGCMPGRLPDFWEAQAPSKALEVRVLTYNLFWWNLFGIRHGNGGSASRLIAASGPFDMMGFQECEDVARVLNDAGLSGQYGFFAGDGSKTSAICMAYRRSSWLLLGQGLSYVAWDKLGNRAAQWMRLQHIPSGQKVFFCEPPRPIADQLWWEVWRSDHSLQLASAHCSTRTVWRYAYPGRRFQCQWCLSYCPACAMAPSQGLCWCNGWRH